MPDKARKRRVLIEPEMEHFDIAMNWSRPDVQGDDPGAQSRPFVNCDFSVSPSPTGYFGKELIGNRFWETGYSGPLAARSSEVLFHYVFLIGKVVSFQDARSVARTVIELNARRFENGGVVDDPGPKRHHPDKQSPAQGGERVIDPWRHLAVVAAENESIAFQMTQGSGQHALRDPCEPSCQLGVS